MDRNRQPKTMCLEPSAPDDQGGRVHHGDAGGDATEGGPVQGGLLGPSGSGDDDAAHLDDDLGDRADTDGQEDRGPERGVDEGSEPDAENGRGTAEERSAI